MFLLSPLKITSFVVTQIGDLWEQDGILFYTLLVMTLVQIELVEREATYLPQDVLPLYLGERLWRNFSRQVDVAFPTPKTNYEWCLTGRGWVGYIPLAADYTLFLQPKVPLQNLFHMLTYAYSLTNFQLLAGIVRVESWPELYELLADVLAKRILQRTRRGLYRAYVVQTDKLPYIRGRLQQAWPQLDHSHLNCQYQQLTADLLENKIFTYTLWLISRSRLCGEEVQVSVRQAYRVMQSVAPAPAYIRPTAITAVNYHRLNQDYEALHALCRFFLTHTGPGYQRGDWEMLPFLINMERLFEQFVAAWLERHLPANYFLRVQERVSIDDAGQQQFQIDLVLYQQTRERPVAVLDTKYKTAVSAQDIAQILAYAQIKNSPRAILIYPTKLSRPLQTQVGQTQLRSLSFSLAKDNLEESGQVFLEAILK